MLERSSFLGQVFAPARCKEKAELSLGALENQLMIENKKVPVWVLEAFIDS